MSYAKVYRQILRESRKIQAPDIRQFIQRRTKEMFQGKVQASHTPEQGLNVVKRYTLVRDVYNL
jgi:hypothetical protein